MNGALCGAYVTVRLLSQNVLMANKRLKSELSIIEYLHGIAFQGDEFAKRY